MANDLVAAKLRSYWLCFHEQLPYDRYDQKCIGEHQEQGEQQEGK
jgi:hypothetical protein